MMKKITLFMLALLGLSLSAQTPYILDYDGYDEFSGQPQGYTYARYIWPLNTDANAGFGNTLWAVVDYNQLIVTEDYTSFQSLPSNGTYTITIDSFQLFYNYNPDASVTPDNDFTFAIYDFDDVTRNSFGTPDQVPNPVATATPLWDSVYTENELTINATQLEVLTIVPNLTLSPGQNFSVFMKNESDTLSAFNLLMGYNENCNDQELGLLSAAPYNSTFLMDLGANGKITPTLYTFGGGSLSCDQFYGQNIVLTAFVTITPDAFYVEASSDQTYSATCPGSTVMLDALTIGGSGNYTYSWSPATGLSSTTDAQVIATVGNATQQYTLTVHDVDNNIDSVATVNVLSFGVTAVAAGPEDVTLSCGQTTNINATATTGGTPVLSIDSIYWSGANPSNPLVTDIQGQYIVTAENSVGCKGYDTVTVSVQGTNNVDFTTTGLLCTGQIVNIDNASDRTDGWNFTWYIKQGNDTISSPGGENFIYNFTDAGSYQLILVGDSASCSFSKTRTITVNDGTQPPCVSSISTLDFNNLQIFPNPANANLTVNFELDNTQNIDITVYTVTGNKVATQNFNANSVSTTFNTSNFNEGVYILKIETEKGVKTQKFVVRH